MALVQIILATAGAYALFGVVFALAFAVRGAGAIDHSVKGSHPAFRLLIIPGAAALWPFLLIKWVAASRSGGAL